MPRNRTRPGLHRLALPLIVGLLLSPAATPAAEPVHAASYVVMDAATGAVLASRDPDKPHPVASLQKIVTALVVLEHSHTNDLVRISHLASRAKADHIIWPEGETFTVEQLLYGMLVESSNGAAIALAEHVAGSQTGFAVLMNQKATELGATHSRFVNSNGLDATGQQSSAHDMALFAQALLADRLLASIVQTRQYEIPWPDGTTTTLHSIDRFLVTYPGAIGIKTGFTSVAGNCLAAAAYRRGRTVIAIAIHSTTVTEDATTLIDQAFSRLGAGAPEPHSEDVAASPSTAAGVIEREPHAQVFGQSSAVEPTHPHNGRSPSPSGLAIVLATSGIVAVRRRRYARR